jgi:hypothetical protein
VRLSHRPRTRTATRSTTDDAEVADLEVVGSGQPSLNDLQQFALPKLALTGSTKRFRPQEGISQHFLLKRLTWALQNNLSYHGLLQYFSHFHSRAIAESINENVGLVPAIFYAVGTNNEDIVRTWVEYGGDIHAIESRTGLPLLAFAIINAGIVEADTTPVVLTLLNLGADASIFPRSIYLPVLQDFSQPSPSAAAPGTAEPPELIDENKKWCNEFFKQQLTKTMNLSQRYFISKHIRIKGPSGRLRQVAAEHKVTGLFGLPFSMIGQGIAIKVLTDRLLSYLMIPNNKPLVLMFAGMFCFGS